MPFIYLHIFLMLPNSSVVKQLLFLCIILHFPEKEKVLQKYSTKFFATSFPINRPPLPNSLLIVMILFAIADSSLT